MIDGALRSVLQRVAVCCSVLQCVAVCCNLRLRLSDILGSAQCVAGCCCVLQGVAVCCSVLQCVAVGEFVCVMQLEGSFV